MNTARRWYIYLVSAISLNSAVWAVIALLRNLLAGGGGEITAIAFQIATIIISLPVFLIHWLWAQRLADRDPAEREAELRRIYFYGMLAGFLGPIIANTYRLMDLLLWMAVGKPDSDSSYRFSSSDSILYNIIAIFVLGLLWFYQKQMVSADAKIASETGSFAMPQRLYFLFFSGWGLSMAMLAIIHILRWIMYQFGGRADIVSGWDIGVLATEVARLIVGAPLWLIFWRQAQYLFSGPSEDEHESALRKFYLYAAVFAGVLSFVTNATIILAGFFRRLLSLPSEGDIRDPLPIIIGMALLWAYHAYVLRSDGARSAESPRQAEIRRQYLYLVAGIGLAAFLVGFSGDLSVLIRSFSQSFIGSLKEQLAWFTAGLIAGLPVWLFPWRQAQVGAEAVTPAGIDERRSTVRKNYLYVFLFIATMTVLSSAVYILYRLLSLALGESGEGNLLTAMSQAIAYALVGIGVLLYHGSVLRGDGNANRRDRANRVKDVRVIVMDVGDTGLGRAVYRRLHQEEPDLNFELIVLSADAQEEASMLAIPAKLNAAGLIIGPWSIAVHGGTVSAEVAWAVVNSPARKILIPAHIDGWDWVGIDKWNVDKLTQNAVRSVKQWIDGEEIKPPRGIGGGILKGIGILVVLWIALILIFDGF